MIKVLRVLLVIVFSIGFLGALLGFIVMCGAESITDVAQFDYALLIGLLVMLVGMLVAFISYMLGKLLEALEAKKEQENSYIWKSFELYEETKTVSRTDQSTTRL